MWRVVGTDEVYDTMEEAEEAYFLYYADSDDDFTSGVKNELEKCGYSLFELAGWLIDGNMSTYDLNRIKQVFQNQREMLVPDIEEVEED